VKRFAGSTVVRMRSALAVRLAPMMSWQMLFFALLFLGLTTVTLANQHQQSDEGSYLIHAHHLAGASYTSRGNPDLWFGPGLPLLLAPLVRIHAGLEVMRILLGPLVLWAAVFLFHQLLRLRLSSRAAWVGTGALAGYLPFYVLLPSLHSEVLAVLLVVIYMYALTRYLAEQRTRFLLLAGGSLGYLALTRVVFGWIVAATLVASLVWWLLRRDHGSRGQASACVLALALCIPWLSYTYSLSHQVFYWGSSGGQSLYWMAAPYPGHLGDWQSANEALTDPSLAADRAEFQKVNRLSQIHADRVLRRDAIRLIKAHPRTYLSHVAANLSRLWLNTPYSFTPQKLSTIFYVIPNALLLFGLTLSAAVLWARQRTLAPEVVAFAFFLALGIILQAPLAAYTRMLAPLVPLIIWLTVFAAFRYLRLVEPTR
jgi:hypothetical protein